MTKRLAPAQRYANRIAYLKNDIKYQRRNFLAMSGWKCTCNYPGGLWLWSKNFPRSDYTAEFIIRGASTKKACKMEYHFRENWNNPTKRTARP